MDALASLSPATRAWFERAFDGPTPAQELAWPAIATGAHVLVQAPTGSGKTLAAFLHGIDRLNEAPSEGLRLLYISPLKALNYDIERNLRGPLAGLGSSLTVGVRTGDTAQRDRQRMLRQPPDVLITTPESLYLLLTSQGREMLRSVETVILDEVHAVAGTKRGSHLAVSLERLERVAAQPFQRIGLSATQRPLAEIGRFVAGTGREITLVDAGQSKELDLEVVIPVEDLRELGARNELPQPVVQDGVEMDSGYEANSHSIWPSIYPALLDLVRAHRSTIVFVNNRRLAERLALRINELAEEEVARAHHGSLAREQRVLIEEDLKAGRIPCLVATSSLELGIDMGAVDLVVQVESPKSVARGLQRVGRAGHELGSVSKGRIFPKFRADLLECAVVAKAMREGAIEETAIPRNPLDVLAQQVVAICAEDEIAVDELHALLRGAYPFAELSREQLENVLDMLAGRYPSDEFAELRPRIVWDRTAGVIRGRQGARRLAVTNAGTIPDRGLYGVFQVGDGGRVGELDEEMVYEAREGQTFMLGASTWRIEEITRDRVLVSPAPGAPGAVPFWKGEGVGRPYELGARIGAASRSLAALSDESATRKLRDDYHLDGLAAKNLLAFLREQERLSALPTDKTVVVERFRDEIGDWRICVLTPFGGRVHAPWAMALQTKLRDTLSLDVQSLWSDDGIALHLPDADVPPSLAELLVEPEELEDLVVQEVGGTALFGARFRENAARALLIPRRRPGQRTPLWQQRLKAQSLLEVARPYGSFPIILETYRECLQDVFDLPALRGILHGLRSRELDLVELETPSASPMAASLLFDYVATYMYADDTPAAERRAQALSLDRELLRELLGQEELRDLVDPGALAEVEASLRAVPRNADELHDLLRRVGELRDAEADPGFAETLVRERRAFRSQVGDVAAVIAAEDAGLYRDAFGVMPPGGLPEAFLEPVDGALERVALRFARSHGPFTTGDLARRYALEHDVAEALLAGLEARDLLVRGELRPGGVEREWCDPDVLRRIRRATLATLRREIEPTEQAALGRFLPGWHGIDRRASLREALVPLQGLALPVGLWETEILPRRVPQYQPAQLDQICASGEVVWVGAGLDRVALYYREDASLLGAPTAGEPLSGPVHDALRAALGRSAEFWADLLVAAELDAADALPALWELVWAGEVTNDAWAPLRSKRRYGVPTPERRPRRFSRTRGSGEVATAGRWSLTARLFAAASAPADRRPLAELLLERQGIVTRDGVRAEGITGGYGAVYGELRALETVGACRRGYFVEGLGGAQFALPGAVERLRELRKGVGDDDEPLVLAAADPAQPYGGVLPWPRRAAARAARVAGAHVVLLGGEAALYVERGGRSLLPLRDPDPEWLTPALDALVAWVRSDRGRRLSVERFDGHPVVETDALPLLVDAGFLAGPRRAVLRP
ncbi:DEAD/DEAH box helicase [Gaiella sp.]|uniref:DEAD/DEAH box helicase n=1 Tax=Gaiella sp. TaxID=2663207 RepID=UPI002E36AB9C|nr:DEAD/DEAH box helicase [Gaiella sp.]HEX5583288.1 DEAD/DEAH box helicase [Gaiella sp.]